MTDTKPSPESRRPHPLALYPHPPSPLTPKVCVLLPILVLPDGINNNNGNNDGNNDDDNLSGNSKDDMPSSKPQVMRSNLVPMPRREANPALWTDSVVITSHAGVGYPSTKTKLSRTQHLEVMQAAISSWPRHSSSHISVRIPRSTLSSQLRYSGSPNHSHRTSPNVQPVPNRILPPRQSHAQSPL